MSNPLYLTIEEYVDLLLDVLQGAYKGQTETKWHPEDLGHAVTMANDSLTASLDGLMRLRSQEFAK